MMTKMLTPKKAPPKKRQQKSHQRPKPSQEKPRAAAKKVRQKAKKMGNRGWLKTLWGIAWKMGLATAALLLFVGIHLDSVVKQRFEGQLFDLPTVVYARVLDLSP